MDNDEFNQHKNVRKVVPNRSKNILCCCCRHVFVCSPCGPLCPDVVIPHQQLILILQTNIFWFFKRKSQTSFLTSCSVSMELYVYREDTPIQEKLESKRKGLGSEVLQTATKVRNGPRDVVWLRVITERLRDRGGIRVTKKKDR